MLWFGTDHYDMDTIHNNQSESMIIITTKHRKRRKAIKKQFTKREGEEESYFKGLHVESVMLQIYKHNKGYCKT